MQVAVIGVLELRDVDLYLFLPNQPKNQGRLVLADQVLMTMAVVKGILERWARTALLM